MDLAAVWTRFTVEERATVEPLHYGRGRMLGLFFAGYLAALSIGALVIGAAFDAVGIEDSLLVCAGCVGLFAVWSIWDTRHPIPEPPERAPSGS